MKIMSRRNTFLLSLLGILGGLLLLIVLLNVVPLYAASSQTETNTSLGTGRSGETLPANMAPGFTLYYQVEGISPLATAVRQALPEALAETSVGGAEAVSDLNAVAPPRLFVDLEVGRRLWTPLYGQAQITANIYFASAAEAPWPADDPMIFEGSPEIQAEGEVTVRDATWGLLSKPAYNRLLGEALADAIAAQLQQDVFRLP